MKSWAWNSLLLSNGRRARDLFLKGRPVDLNDTTMVRRKKNQEKKEEEEEEEDEEDDEDEGCVFFQ